MPLKYNFGNINKQTKFEAVKPFTLATTASGREQQH